jgi:amidohydrolase
MNADKLQQLIGYRRELHQHPEVSGEEQLTGTRIKNWLETSKPDQIITELGGYGLAAVFSGTEPGPAVMYRAELDALPISESNTFDYRSSVKGKAHLCGHDGHMSILLGLADYFGKNRPQKGSVVLLFQPAEETGMGAEQVINNPAFKTITPDYVFAIHNLPGFPLHQIQYSDNNFAAASCGLIIRLRGYTSHAAEPEKGRSPAIAVAEIINAFQRLPETIINKKGFVLVTIIHVKIGEVAFGTTPGEAVVMATLRARHDHDLQILSKAAEKSASQIAQKEKLEISMEYTETFPATVNNYKAATFVKDAAEKLDLDVKELEEPFKWTEDFGHFTSRFKGALTGLGAGLHHPALHNPDYDFPDELITTGVNLFIQIFEEIQHAEGNGTMNSKTHI